MKRLSRPELRTSGRDRKRLLTDLFSAGFPTEKIGAPTSDEPHTFLLWATSPATMHLYLFPSASIDETLVQSLYAASGMSFNDAFDCSLLQFGAAMRIAAAISAQPVSVLAKRTASAAQAFPGDKELSALPEEEELEERWGQLDPSRVGGRRPGHCDFDETPFHAPIDRSISLLDLYVPA